MIISEVTEFWDKISWVSTHENECTFCLYFCLTGKSSVQQRKQFKGWRIFPVPSAVNCHPLPCAYLQKMFGESHLHLRPDLQHVLGQGWGFAFQNASAARGSVKSLEFDNRGSLCSKKALKQLLRQLLSSYTATSTDINQEKKKHITTYTYNL